jgi:hypothetical protein
MLINELRKDDLYGRTGQAFADYCLAPAGAALEYIFASNRGMIGTELADVLAFIRGVRRPISGGSRCECEAQR